MSNPVGVAIRVHWPLYCVPGCALAFYALYFALHSLSRRLVPGYRHWPEINQRSWRQNVCATIHTYVLMLLLIVALGIDGAALQRALLVPHYSPLAYLAVSFSLSYMCLTLPWSCRMYFGSSDERKATRPSLIIHHAFVVLAEGVYLLTQTSPWPGILSLVLFEASNLFLMPHHLMTQLDYHGKWHFLNGLAFFATCTLARVFGCVALGISYVRDAATLHERDWELVLCVSLSLVSFWAILLLSLYWYVHDVLGEVHKELAIKWGGDYLIRVCCPCCRGVGWMWLASVRGTCSVCGKRKSKQTIEGRSGRAVDPGGAATAMRGGSSV